MSKPAINILFLILFAAGAYAADVQITFRDSTNIDDAYIYSASSTYNFGRATSGATYRVINYVGRNYSNYWYILMRISSFKDSTDNYPGLIIDSVRGVMFVNAATYDPNDQAYFAPVGIDTNMNWVEGNGAAAAANCEVDWTYAQTVGGGSCPTEQAWNTAGATGAADTMGIYTGEPEDSTVSGGQQIFDWEAAGDSIYFYLDTAMCNFWKDYSYANEGFALFHWDGPNDQYYDIFYGSESNGACADSVPYFILFGHTTAGAATATIMRTVIE